MKETIIITGENIEIKRVNQESNYANSETAAKKTEILQSSCGPKTKAEKRIAALMARGIDTSMYFPMGDDRIIKIENGSAVDVEMEDEVESELMRGGYVDNYTLFRRWVMAQMFRMLRWEAETGVGVLDQVESRGMFYKWKILENELHAQWKMVEHSDMDNYNMRNRWFNGETVSSMVKSYIEALRVQCDENMYRVDQHGFRAPKHTCKGVPYVRVGGTNIFFADLHKKVFAPLMRIERMMHSCGTARDLYKLVRKFNELKMPFRFDSKVDDVFTEAYLGSGAYFTMRNLIMFHGANFLGACGREESLDMVEAVAQDKDGEKMMRMMRNLIEESGISIHGKISEWNK